MLLVHFQLVFTVQDHASNKEIEHQYLCLITLPSKSLLYHKTALKCWVGDPAQKCDFERQKCFVIR
jgi:hypothetical protein